MQHFVLLSQEAHPDMNLRPAPRLKPVLVFIFAFMSIAFRLNFALSIGLNLPNIPLFWQQIETQYVSWLGDVKQEVQNEPIVSVPEFPTQSTRTIIVDLSGNGNFTTVQSAVNSIPDGNTQPVIIQVNAGTYWEKVLFPSTKPYITLQGQGREITTIVWNDTAAGVNSTYQSASVAIESQSFTAYNISFKNSAPPQLPGAEREQAVALRVTGDQAAFYGCSFLAHQDTLYDHRGRHFFKNCYIEGSVDFVFGNGLSLYKYCTLRVVPMSPGALTAQKRASPDQNTGFSFVNCAITGSGIAYLGRAWGPYSLVVYSYTFIDDIILPQGWYDWGDPTRNETVYYGQYRCSGPGSLENSRVPWSHELTDAEAQPFLGLDFINGTSWVPEQ